MAWKAAAILAGAGLGMIAALVARRRPVGEANLSEGASDRWRVVTIGLPETEVIVNAELPAPMRELSDVVDVRTRPAPGDRGTELYARPRPGASKQDGEKLPGRIRRALRESKQLLEAGEITTNQPQPEGHRPATPAGILIDTIARRSPEKGIL